MKINNISHKLIEKIVCGDIHGDNFIREYTESHKGYGCEMIEFYQKHYVRNEKTEVEIEDIIQDIIKHQDRIGEILAIDISHYFHKLQKILNLDQELIAMMHINVFLGFNTCEGFSMYDDNHCHINIAIESCIHENNAYLSSVIVHEITHVIREYYQPTTMSSMGSILIDEGLACYLSEVITNDSSYVFPIGVEVPDRLEAIVEDYLANKSVQDGMTIHKWVNFGDNAQGITPGLGYVVGYELIRHMMDTGQYAIDSIYKLPNREILRLCEEEWGRK